MGDESLNLKISMPDGHIEVRELLITCGFTSLVVAYWPAWGDKPWCIRQCSNGSMDRQFGYATLEEARDEAWRSVGFREPMSVPAHVSVNEAERDLIKRFAPSMNKVHNPQWVR